MARATLSVVLLLACGNALAQSTPGAATDSSSVGYAVYRQQYCGLCHVFARAGTAGTFGPTHDAMDTIAESRLQDERYKGEATDIASYVRESIVSPEVFLVPGYEVSPYRMPAYKHLSDEQVDALVQFLLGND